MTGFIRWLERSSEKDARMKGLLRRSLAFEPGEFAPAFPYVEPFASEVGSPWGRRMLYLVAGLWAAYVQGGQRGEPVSLGGACAIHHSAVKSASTERRLMALLNADPDHVPLRLRQLVALLREQPLDFEDLLKGLLYWNVDRREIQNNWTRDFYRSSHPEGGNSPDADDEECQ